MISRAQAIKIALEEIGESAVIVHANGYICRESITFGDRESSFYMIGSMGLASSIALGIAVSKPELQVVVFDGDGNVLMNLGALANASALQQTNYLHIVFDNGVYGSTGDQPSISNQIPIARVALAAGYKSAVSTEEPDEFRIAIREALEAGGPSMALIKTNTECMRDAVRIPHSPTEIRDRLMNAIDSSGGSP